MKEEGVSVHDCPGWVRSRCYLAVAEYNRGNTDEALRIAQEMSGVEAVQNKMGEVTDGENGVAKPWADYFRLLPQRVEGSFSQLTDHADSTGVYRSSIVAEVRETARQIDRKLSAGSLAVMWEAKTLPVRLLYAREAEGDFAAGVEALPSIEDLRPYIGHSLVIYLLEGLRQYGLTRQALEKPDFEKSQELLQAMSHTYIEMTKQSDQATSSAEFSYWVRGKSALAMMIPELQGLSVMAGPSNDRESAFNWFSSAVSKQQRASLLQPPLCLYAMENRVAQFKADKEAYLSAGQEYVKSLDRFPNNVQTLSAYEAVLRKLGKEKSADAIRDHIEIVKK